MAKNTSGLKRWTLEARYKVYVRDYLKKMEVMQKKGLEMSTGMLNMTQYDELYKATRNDMGGKGNVNRAIIEKQAWGGMTINKAQAALEGIKKMEPEVRKAFGLTGNETAYQLREQKSFWNLINQEYHRRRAMGGDYKAASLYITETFFGGS